MIAPDPAIFEPFRGRRCLVTGGLGFIGSNLVHELSRAGAHVTVIDALVPQHGGDLRNLDGLSRPAVVKVAHIWDAAAVVPLIADTEFVFNLAGQVSHLESMTEPMRDLDLNARSHLQFLEYLRQYNPTAVVVHSSTRQVYGRPRYLPVDEEHPTNPIDVNGIDKLACEQFHLLYATTYGMPITALRLTNVYGPRQNLQRTGLGFLPVFVRQVLRGETIRLFGDGQQIRDCLHVNDVSAALALAALTPQAAGSVFNLGHPDPMSLRDIASTMVALRPGSRVETQPWPSELARIDIGSFSGDFSKAKLVLGWAPRVSLAEGMADTLSFYGARPWYLSSI